VYPDPRVDALVTREFVAVRSHVKETPALWGTYNTRWTPTVLFLDHRGREAHRVEGFLPTKEFLGQLHFGLGLCYAGVKDWKTAEQHFTHAATDFAETDAGPAGLYWVGVAKYSASQDAADLRRTWEAFRDRHQHTSWAKRTVVWAPADVADARPSRAVADRKAPKERDEDAAGF
jgi:hypothetical protein